VVLRDDEVERALVVVAHPTMSISGPVARSPAGPGLAPFSRTACSATGTPVESILMSPGRPSPRIRRAEEEAAAPVLGVSDVRFLGYPDGCIEPSYVLRRDITSLIDQDGTPGCSLESYIASATAPAMANRLGRTDFRADR
jgi:hypothetical protein